MSLRSITRYSILHANAPAVWHWLCPVLDPVVAKTRRVLCARGAGALLKFDYFRCTVMGSRLNLLHLRTTTATTLMK